MNPSQGESVHINHSGFNFGLLKYSNQILNHVLTANHDLDIILAANSALSQRNEIDVYFIQGIRNDFICLDLYQRLKLVLFHIGLDRHYFRYNIVSIDTDRRTSCFGTLPLQCKLK